MRVCILLLTSCNDPGISPSVTYHPIPTPQLPPEAEIDTPEMIEAAVAVERDEQDILLLTELAEIGMRLVRAHEAYVTARLAVVSAEGAPLNPGENLYAPFDKLALTIRRTVALKKHLAAEVKTHRAALVTERAARREQRTRDHKRAVKNEIDNVLTEAFTVMYGDGEAETDEGDALCREMLADKENLLDDAEAFNDYLTRPVGETVAMLCVALGLPADTCVKQGDTWLVKRPPTAYRIFRDALPPLSGEGQDAKRPGWGSVDDTHKRC